MTLVKLVDNSRTDKNTLHSYLPLYQKLLESKKYTATNILEVGICDGGSIKLWSDFFVNATVHGLDIIDMDEVWDEIKTHPRIVIHASTDAYNPEVVSRLGVKFDFLLDDGPHTLDSMKKFIQLYSDVMTDDGILIIEDVPSWSWIELLRDVVPPHLKRFVKAYDLRANKNRYDDIVFTIDKGIQPQRLSLQFI